MTMQFEADVCPETYSPRLRLNFANGWSVSIALRQPSLDQSPSYALAALAACPAGQWGMTGTELGENEASPDEVAAYIAAIAARPQATAS